ncbi:hypothetical protein DPMN_012861 [Dreissena polymorpha]|uniref:Uncharacterized protein n=1 Tax=Dreissena polymorpha TaxID=45954 RepID=A0A9D4N8U2_DREPO|nr:hypothetical protein DPMN_012861 [Dreissena polymorpha]
MYNLLILDMTIILGLTKPHMGNVQSTDPGYDKDIVVSTPYLGHVQSTDPGYDTDIGVDDAVLGTCTIY